MPNNDNFLEQQNGLLETVNVMTPIEEFIPGKVQTKGKRPDKQMR